jgi:hypothetical protein
MLHKIKVNERTLNSKPEKKLAGHISNNINVEKLVTIEEFSQLVTQPYAYTWTACHFEGDRKTENWKSQSIFYLDYDKGTPLNVIKKQLSDMSLRYNVIYNTLSDSIECRKFRVVFFIDGIIKCRDTAEWIQTNLVKMFPDSDSAVGTVERMVYPGYSVLHLDKEEISGDELIKIINSYVISKDKQGKNNFHTRNMKQFEFSINEEGEYEYKLYFDKNFKINNQVDLPQIIEKFNWEKAFNEIKILNDFNNGIRLKHMEVFGLATNLMYIKGGLSYMKNKMNQVNQNPNRVDRFGKPADKYIHQQFATLPQVKKNKYLPNNLSKFSPYEEDHQFINILESIRWRRGRVDIVENFNKIALSEAEDILKKEFENKVRIGYGGDIFEADTSPSYINKVIVFKVPTGLGKTRELEVMKNTLIATKTNALKRELSSRMQIEHYMTPDYPQFSCDSINELISSYINSNLFEETSKMISKIANGNELTLSNGSNFTPTAQDIILAEDYKSDNVLCRNTRETVLTTHSRALFDKGFNHDTVIFDECPLDTIIDMGVYRLNFTIFDNTEFKNEIDSIEHWVRNNLGFNQIVKRPDFIIKNYNKFCEFCALNGESGLIKLLDSDFVYRENDSEVVFATKKDIPDKNIIIMSATAPIEIYKYIFGNKLEVIDVSNVQKRGIIKQYTGKSWSRSSFKKSSEKSKKELLEIIGDRPVITFRNYKNVFKNAAPFHFGNTLGYDELRGQDIAVVGTDNKPLYVYFFYAKLIGLDLKTSDNLLDVRIVEWNGFRFRTMTFENEDLRNIQLSMIESELIQAVGRNRNLREDCETLLFSSQPLRISDIFIEN